MATYRHKELTNLMADFLETIYFEDITQRIPDFVNKTEYRTYLLSQAEKFLRRKALK